MLEADDDVVGIANHAHVAQGRAPSPALSPKIEDVVEVNVREQQSLPLRFIAAYTQNGFNEACTTGPSEKSCDGFNWG
jgi:hypothetical protein